MIPTNHLYFITLSLFFIFSACESRVSKLEKKGMGFYEIAQPYMAGSVGEEILAIDSTNAVGWMLKAMKMHRQFPDVPLSKSLATVNKAIEIKPDFTEAYIIKAKVFRFMRDSEKLSETLDEAIALDSTNIKNLNFAGESYHSLEMYYEAAEAYSRLIAIDSFAIENWANRGLNNRLGGYFEQAKTDLLYSVKLGKTIEKKEHARIFTYTQLAKLSEDQEHYKQASTYWDTVISISEAYMVQDSLYDFWLHGYYWNSAEINKKIGNNSKALLNLTKAVDLNGGHFYKDYLKRALVHIELGDFDAACSDLHKVDSLYPEGSNQNQTNSLISIFCTPTP